MTREAPRQIPLDLPVEDRREADDFLVSASNEAAFSVIEAWPDWPDKVLILTGPEASGKSHLASIWAERAHAWTLSASDLDIPRIPHLVSQSALVIEDADRGLDEHALFHLLNAARERGRFIVITARTVPDLWSLKTPDLLSRLRLAPSVALEQADDALLQAVLVKFFVDRQLVVDTALIATLANRIDRSIAAARRAVERLDREALAQGRRVNRSLALELFRAQDTELPAPDGL